jgi:dTMP kinase
MFIAFEGLDGSGKSTLIKSLSTHLKTLQIDFVLTREPGGTKLAEEIRNILLKVDDEVPFARTEALLYQASRAQHVAQVIQPALLKNQWVLCDRFSASSIAFQAFARGLDVASIEWLNYFSTQNIFPHLNVLLDLTVEESLRRIENRNRIEGTTHDRFEKEAPEFHNQVRDGFLYQVQKSPNSWLVLDATLKSEDLFQELVAELNKRKYFS